MAGGGIGEAMLLGAATGGITSLLRGKDPIKGAVVGAGFGAAGGAIGGAMGIGGGAAGGAGGAAGGAGGAAGAAGGTGVNLAAAAAPQVAAPAAFSNQALGLQGALGASPAAAMGPGVQLAQLPNQISNTAAQISAAGTAAAPQQSGIASLMDSFKNMSTAQKVGTGVAGSLALGALFDRPEEMPGEEEPDWSKWKKFQPTFYAAQGGAVPQDTSGSGIDNLYVSNKGPLDNSNQMQVPENNYYAEAPAAGYLGNSVKMMAEGGISNLGSYSDGGQLLKGPGDGVSDNIPATISGQQPARLADGEFVVPARIVSELGNGSTDAGARQLYAMMRRVEQARENTTGKGNIATDTRAANYLPA